ncbi:hypothetical protein OSB04_019602 [Centaurea solstitialis]|uniref:Retrovirus-related Pol polyprotein from transposon TNT 1-94 n=1 Tax=Centaurea solstitialis TaxID=347529 RepID=A0AA38SSA8_9ASTR|nr:hypothetical protein OSB04_019602 [Centaurea solstitialis]
MALQAKDNYFDTGSAGKPPRFNKDNFSLWKTRMELFLSGSDPQIPYFLENGPHVPTQTVHPIAAAAGQPAVPERQLVKPVTDWNDEDRRLVNIDTKARSLIAMSLPDDVFHSVCHLRSAKEIWDTLCVQDEGTAVLMESRKIFLVRQYESFIHQKDETLSQLHQRFNCLLIDLKTIGTIYSNSEVVTKFMEALPEHWEIYTSCLTMSKDIKTLTLSELYGILLNREQQKKLKKNLIRDSKESKSTSIALVSDSVPPVAASSSSVTITELESSDSDMSEDPEFNESLALLTRSFKKFAKKGNFHKKKHLSITDKPKSDPVDKATAICYNCQGKGHFANDCRYRKSQFAPSSAKSSSKNPKYQRLKEKYKKMKTQRKGKGLIAEECDWDDVSSDDSSDEEDTQVALMAIIEEPTLALMAKIEEVPEEILPQDPEASSSTTPEASTSATDSSSQDKGIWYLDSGCSRHMTGSKSVLTNYREERGPAVTFGGNGRGQTRGYGTLTNGVTTFKRVAYVEGLMHNLLSISQLCDKNHKVSFSKKKCKVKNRKKEVILNGVRHADIYIINMNTSTDNFCFVSRASTDMNWLWHKRLSHLNFKTLNQLCINNLVIGLPDYRYTKESLCSACEKGKQTRASFKSKQISSISSPLQLLHMDLFGPVNVQSIGGKKYTLVIVDEYSRYTWVFFLRAKSDAPEEIILFVRKMEKLNNLTVRSIRSDHGTEFKNSTLESFFEQKGISQNFSSVRTPQQNGVAERRNRTLIEAARSMLSEANLATQFWAEAVNTACYTQNRSLIVKRFRRTAYELFRNRKPSIKHLHIFGCVCYILNNKDNLGKFDSKSDDGIFLGYSSISKTYRVFNKRRQTIEETIHVKFDESGPTFPHPNDNTEINQWADSFFQVPEPPIADSSPQDLPEPPGFVDPKFPDHVYKLNKALYGLKTGPRAWYDTLSTFLLSKGFVRGKIDSTLFLKKKYPKHILLVQIYVDDIIFGSTNPKLLRKVNMYMRCLRNLISHLYTDEDSNGPPLSFDKDSKGKPVDVTLYRGMIGSLLYLTASRPDIIYLKGTPNMGLWYSQGLRVRSNSLFDSDFAGCKIDRKRLLPFANNPVLTSKTKHIEVRYHFIRDHVMNGDIELHFVPTEYQLADLFTKPLDVTRFKYAPQ